MSTIFVVARFKHCWEPDRCLVRSSIFLPRQSNMENSDEVSLRRAFLSRLLATAALTAAMLSGSGGKAFAVVGTPETAQCTGKCETCIEYEVAKDGTQRCLKCGIAPNCLGNPGDPGLTSDFTDIVKEHNCANPLTWSPTAAASRA